MFNTHNTKKQDINSKAFTVIELLVVIAIIGLISSVVLVSLKGSTGKARISKSLEFSQTVLNAIGVDAVGIWSFDEGALGVCAGGDVCDKSGYGNYGTITGATFVTGEENTPHAIMGVGEGRSALKFDGNHYIKFGNVSSLQMGTGAITVEHWIKPSVWSSYKGLFFGGGGGGWHGYGTHLASDGKRFRYEIYGSTGGRQSFNVDIGIKANQWNHIVAIFDGVNNKMKCYLNGKEKDNRNISNPGNVQNTHMFGIGAHADYAWFYNGLIDEVRIYERALSSAEIQQHYAAGVAKHNLALISF